MNPKDMLTELVRGFDSERDAIAVVEVGKRQWRCFHLQVTDAGRPKLTDVTELVALGGEFRAASRGRGAQPIACDWGVAIARRVASVTGLSLHVQVEGVDRFEGRCEP